MQRNMIALTFLLLLAAATQATNYTDCGENFFYNLNKNRCQECSQCKPDQWLQRLCSKFNDTTCGGRIKFDFFNGDISDEKPTAVTPQLILSNEDKVYWKKLAFSLIGLLSFLVTVTTLTILITCYKFRNTGWFCKHVSQDQDDIENGYVVIHKFIPDSASMYHEYQPTVTASYSGSGTSEQTHHQVSYLPKRSKPYRPKRRLMTEYVDDVFESDDSAGSRTLRMPLATIPEADGSFSDAKPSPAEVQS